MNDRRHENDDPVERAAAALRDAPAPEGPTAELAARTLAAVNATAASSAAAGDRNTVRRNRTMSIALKVAAVVAVVACGAAAYVAFVRPDRPGGQSIGMPVGPVQQTRPTPDTAAVPPPPASGETIVNERPGPAPADGVSVVGRVVFEGEPPEPKEIDMAAVRQCQELHASPVYDESVVVGENGELANVVVSVSEGLPPDASYGPPAEPAVLDQEGCRYKPHVLAMMVGQEIRVKNSDPFLHNVHTLPVDNDAINQAQPNIDPGKKIGPMKVSETFPVKCDVHPWMLCHFVVLEHPFFSVTGQDGVFRIKGLPPGQYTLKAWHEKFGERHAQVTVEPDRAAQVKFTFKAEE